MAWDPAHSRWVILFFSAALLYNSVNGIIRGRAILFVRDVTRSDDGCLFWFAVVMSATLGVAGVIIALLK